MSAAERGYRLLLRAYPLAFRARYGREMTLLFRDLRREPGGKGIGFWIPLVWDVARSAPAQRLDVSRVWWSRDIQTKGGSMMTMAILAILIGAVEAIGAMQEGWAGGIVNGDGYSLVAGTLGAAAGVLLVAAGIALLRRSPRAVALAQSASIACLGVFVLIGVVKGRMSIFATILGIGFPIAMLLFLRMTRGRRMSDAKVA